MNNTIDFNTAKTIGTMSKKMQKNMASALFQ